MEVDITTAAIVQILVPFTGLLPSLFSTALRKPEDEFDYRVNVVFEEQLGSEVNELGDIALQVAEKVYTEDGDSEPFEVAVNHAVAKVMRGAFDDYYVNDDQQLFQAVDPDVAEQQEQVREKLSALDRANWLYTRCKWFYLIWFGSLILLVGFLILSVAGVAAPLLHSGVASLFTRTALDILLGGSILFALVSYVSGALWFVFDRKLSSHLRREEVRKVSNLPTETTASNAGDDGS